ncbi:MAG: hypothetical protein IPK80_03115 [Nannocystis sp.]|nr:hypothetical protein [Nannocystis sp.]
MGRRLERSLAVLNGAVGDYLARTGNGLATPTTLVRDGAIVDGAPAGAGPRPVVFVHGLMGTEADWRDPSGDDFGAALARDLGATPLYVRYNSGRSIALKRFKPRIWSAGRVRSSRGIRAGWAWKADFFTVWAVPEVAAPSPAPTSP